LFQVALSSDAAGAVTRKSRIDSEDSRKTS
jgi:hypothetical protein